MIPAELEEVRRTRRTTEALVEGLPQEQLDRPPAPDRWTLGEILDHLLLTDAVYRREIGELVARRRADRTPFLYRGFSELDVSVLFLPRSLLPMTEPALLVLNLFVPRSWRDALVRNRALPAQNPGASQPRAGRPGGELRRELATSLAALERLMEDNQDLDFRALRYYHPLLGYNDVPQMLRFVANHESRHQEQIREILARRAA